MSGYQELSLTQSSAQTVSQEPGKKIRRRKREKRNPVRKLTYEIASEYLRYDPETGLLSRRKPSNGQSNTRPEGLHKPSGYMVVNCGGAKYKSHRIIWLLCHGYLPENEIDHINNNRSDNRLVNLREVSRLCNTRNNSIRSDSKSGITGVCFVNRVKRWKASICVNKVSYFLGEFEDLTEAVCYRLAAEQCLDWGTCRAETAASAYVKRMLNP